MQKHCILAFLITFVFLFLTSGFWYASGRLNYCILISLAVLLFLLFYKLTSYLAEFKSLKHQSRVEILFLAVFFAVLFIPMLNIDKSEFSEQENRTLAKPASFINKDGKINYDFGRNVNEWFNDRFNFRDKLIKLYGFVNISTNKNLEIKKEGFIDRQSGFMYYYRNFYRYSAKETKTNLAQLIKLNEFCNKNGIKLYVLITPPKDEIYPPKASIITKKENTDFEKQIANGVNSGVNNGVNNGVKILYPTDEFREAAKNNYVYFKTDDHWTDDGAFTGYKVLMNAIQEDFPGINILTEDDFNYSCNKRIRCDWERDYHYGRTATKLGIFDLDRYHDTEYRYFTHKDYKNLKVRVKHEPMHREKDYFYPKGANYKVILLGTSQNENLTEFIPFTFKNVKRIRTNSVKGLSDSEAVKIIKYWGKDITEYKPDILIFCLTYDNVRRLAYLFKD